MSGKKACIIADLRTGEHLTHIPDVAAVLAAAGWKTSISLKEYGGETLQLAKKAARDGYDLIIGYGGDGTLNAIFNGVMQSGDKPLIANIPGGTFNVWSSAIGVPKDPVKAALTIIDSQARVVDLGHIEVTGLQSAQAAENGQQSEQTKKQKKPKLSSKQRQYFLLNVGMGIDAAMMAHIDKPLKYRVGPLAFDLSLLKTLPEQRPFPLELQQMNDAGQVETSWQGKVWQIYVSKLPLFGGNEDLQPDARADDGLLYISLITANGPLKTVEQVFSLLTQHKPDDGTTHYLHGAHFLLRIPAAITVHVDGSIIKLDDFLHKAEQEVLHNNTNLQEVMVTYHFDAQPKAIQMAIPSSYSGSLFTKPTQDEKTQSEQNITPMKSIQKPQKPTKERVGTPSQAPQSSQVTTYKVSVVGASFMPDKQNNYILATRYKKLDTDETLGIAVRVNQKTLIHNSNDETVAPSTVLELREGAEIVVEGNKTKRNVIRARSIQYSRSHVEDARKGTPLQ